MKKLSVKEKAKRYDEAIEQLRTMMPNWESLSYNGKTFLQDLVHIIPELKESEDERMIQYFKDLAPFDKADELYEKYGFSHKDAITWLEKQVHVKESQISQHENEICKENDNSLTNEDERVRKAMIDFFKHEREEGIVVLHYGVNIESMIDWLEKQGEQETADKVEPKFKNGQWIVWQDKYYKVNYNGCGYELVDQNGLSTSLEYGTIDKNAHLWDITKDAKEGDVLAAEPIEGYCSPFVAIYKKQDEEDFDSYCCIGFDGGFYKGENGHSTDNIHPATKEQREQLEKAITDAGYIFDFDKKELKDITDENGYRIELRDLQARFENFYKETKI